MWWQPRAQLDHRLHGAGIAVRDVREVGTEEDSVAHLWSRFSSHIALEELAYGSEQAAIDAAAIVRDFAIEDGGGVPGGSGPETCAPGQIRAAGQRPLLSLQDNAYQRRTGPD